MEPPPITDWEIVVQKQLLKEQNIRFHEEKLLIDTPALIIEAERLLKEIEIYDPSDRWQYRKGLMLIHIGKRLKNEHYCNEGRMFYNMVLSFTVKKAPSI